MLKRITKVTSLLVCAASIISIVPAMAADVKKVDSQEGTVYSAKAKGAGIYIDAEINGKDEAHYFMTPDGKYNSVDGVDDGMSVDDLLLTQYLAMDDGDTVVDIKNNYKTADDKTRSDLQDDIASTLRKKVKNDDNGRFSDYDKSFNTTTPFSDVDSGLSPYTYTLKNPFKIGSTTVKGTDTVYVDYAGNYVDADYNLGSIKVSTTSGGSSVYIKNTDDTYEIKDSTGTYELKAVINDSSFVGVFSDTIYRWANLSIYKKAKDDPDSNYTNVTDTILFAGRGTLRVDGSDLNKSVPVLQKFSKAVDTDTIDGIKYSKDSTVYFCADYDSNKKTNGGITDEYVLGKSKNDANKKTGYAISATKIKGDATGFASVALDTGNHKLYGETLKLKSENGLDYIDLSDYKDTDVSDNYTTIQTGSGTAWALDSGYVKQWDKSSDDFEKVYKVDGGMSNLSVGNKDLMILWNQDDENYTIINNTTKTTSTANATTGNTTSATTTGVTATTAAAAGWVKTANGTWSYNKVDGTKATGWLKDGGAWYFLKADGIMSTGWVQDGSTWCYLSTSGAMQTGWINDNGTWYYCNASGAMLVDTTVDGYVLGNNGAWIK